jgi:hypothetical protein
MQRPLAIANWNWEYDLVNGQLLPNTEFGHMKIRGTSIGCKVLRYTPVCNPAHQVNGGLYLVYSTLH